MMKYTFRVLRANYIHTHTRTLFLQIIPQEFQFHHRHPDRRGQRSTSTTWNVAHVGTHSAWQWQIKSNSLHPRVHCLRKRLMEIGPLSTSYVCMKMTWNSHSNLHAKAGKINDAFFGLWYLYTTGLLSHFSLHMRFSILLHFFGEKKRRESLICPLIAPIK